jgi:haloalkane dehalogenase
MEVLRTPAERFEGLPDFPFRSIEVEVPRGDGTGRLALSVVLAGPAEGEVVLLLHGEPSWSYLWRTVIPPLVEAGLHCVAPDLVGFGRSDKPAAPSDHTYARHVEWLRAALFDELGLDRVTLVWDWGGLLGLRLLGEHPERFARVVAANTGLPTRDQPMSQAFLAWQEYAAKAPDLPVGRIVASGCTRPLPDAVRAAYEAPFPDERFKAGPKVMPSLVPTRPDDPAAEANRRAWEVLRRFDRPFLTAFSDQDPITGGGERAFQRAVPGAQGREHPVIRGAGHFLQEDAGPALAQVVVDFVRATPRVD